MKKIIFLMAFLLCSIASLHAQYPTLKFRENEKFKILQITDTHYIWGNPASEVVTDLLKEVIDAEQPDLLIFTGDIVVKNKDTKKALDAVFFPVIEKQIPWAYVFGNHDDESEMNREDIMNYIMKMPFCMAVHGDKSISGTGNYTLEVKDKNNEFTASVLYCMDSHSYSPIKEIGKYAWFGFDQIEWYRKESTAYSESNNHAPIPSLAFFHIPLAEYPEMSSKPETLIGNKKEQECNGYLNSGMYAAMRISGDIIGIFVGHDHDNDYIGMWNDIALAYGRYSGGNTVYNNLGKNGCRVIELTENERTFSTYIYLLGGETINHFTSPSLAKKEVDKKK